MIESVHNKPDQGVIDYLKDLLRRAEQGDIRCFVTVYLNSKQQVGRCDAGKYDYDRMIGLLEMGKHDLLMASAEASRTIPLGEDA